MKKNIIAIVGMCGSGKSVASAFLEDLGYEKVYFGGVTLDKLRENGMEINPLNEKIMREKLRSELGMGAYAKILLDNLDNISLVAIICDKKIRYERLEKREIRPLTSDEANKRDIAEIENLAKGGPISYADYFINNNGTLKDYEIRLKEILNNIEKERI